MILSHLASDSTASETCRPGKDGRKAATGHSSQRRDIQYTTYSLPQCSGLTEELWAWRNPSSRKLSACLDGASIDPIGTIIAGRDSVSSFRKPHLVSAPLYFAWGQLRVPVPTLFRSSSRRMRRHGSSKLIRETNHRLPIDVAAGLMYYAVHYYVLPAKLQAASPLVVGGTDYTPLQVPDGNAWGYLAVTTNGALFPSVEAASPLC